MHTPAWLDRPWAKSKKQRAYLAVPVVAVLLIALAGIDYLWKSQIPTPILRKGTFHPSIKHDVQGVNGAVASDVQLCSEMGVDVLKNGGNAADAAVTVALCIGSINFQSSGIGGGGFITVRHQNGTTKVIDCRETAPAAAHKHMFKDRRFASQVGGLASGVPGELAGLQALYDSFGSGNVSWADLFQPVIDLNNEGFALAEPVTFTYLALQAYGGYQLQSPGWEWFIPEDKVIKGINDFPKIISRKALAKTLEKVAKGGAQAFYDPEGEIAPHLVNALKLTGGIMTVEDFAGYEAVFRDTLNTTFLGREVFTSPAPTSGPALILGLHLIEELLNENSHESGVVEAQRLIEVMKWMAAGRSELGDPSFIDNPRIDKIITPEWADMIRGNISDDHTLDSWRDYHPSYEMNEPHGTAHFSVVDKDGMAVAMTTTVNLGFGNMVCDPVTGVVLNSEMDDFSQPDNQNFFELAPSIYNFIAPGKRPLSSTVPTIIVEDDKPVLVIGAAGGSRIVTAVFQAIVRIYGYNLSLLEAIAFPRLHHQLIPEKLSAEAGFLPGYLLNLHKKGHEVDVGNAATAMGGIHWADGTFHAVGDYWRKLGWGAAY